MAELKIPAEATEHMQKVGQDAGKKQNLRQASCGALFLIFQKIWVWYTKNSHHQIPAGCAFVENSP